METSKIGRNFMIVLVMLITTAILVLFVDFKGKLSGLDKELGRKDLANFNWTFAR